MAVLKMYFCLFLYLLPFTFLHAQYQIIPAEGYSPQIGIMVDMLEDLKDRITKQVENLDQEEIDFLFDENANSIGALIMHLIATESYYQIETLEERSWTKDEATFWELASNLGPVSRKEFKGKPIKYYLDLWDQVRNKTLEGLKTKDDKWFASDITDSINVHWVWFHVMEHQANHMGQIALIKNRFSK